MIKNTIYICLLALLAISCDQDESFCYNEKDAIYFNVLGENIEKPWEIDNPEALKSELDFAYRKTGEKDMNWVYDLYYGDSLRADTIKALVSVAGTVSDQPREFYLKAVPLEESLEMTEVEFNNPYCIEAGKTVDTVVFVVKRPVNRGYFGVSITFDFEKSPAFVNSIYGWNKYDFKVSDRYTKPEGWDEKKYGDFSEEKYAFWVTVMQTVYENKDMIWDSDWMPVDILGKLIEELDKYNAAHPDNKKPFDFPRK